MNKKELNCLLAALMLAGMPAVGVAADYVGWVASNDAISEPLAGLTGDAGRGLKLVLDRRQGNCLACHKMPVEGELFQGNLGPPLEGVGSRLTPAQIRLRIVDQRQLNPGTVMPGYYRDPAGLNRVAPGFEGKPYFTPQQVEDVVAYISTLK
jgi:sulfur-oxidizing protein SoxX